MKAVPLHTSAAIAEAAMAVPYPEDAGAFMAGHLTGQVVTRTRILRHWSDLSVAVVDDGGAVLARGLTVPLDAGVEGRDPFPDGGWEQAVLWSIDDLLEERTPDTLCALEIVVHPRAARQGVSRLVLAGMRALARERGFRRLIAPLRPPLKANEPWAAMDEYAARRRDDGLPQDPWLRTHVRAGGRLRGVAYRSTTITAGLERWRAWTGLPLDRDGLVAVPGGLAPLLVNRDLDLGCYVEPNVWVDHPLDAD
ncbi:N-acetyltransferase [Glycomyces terrestris]|uniref:N-acetyltransferase n=1 Tax=Glycomyces terrestris TaxID=2493553 RepID=UPI0018D5362E|nr:N-acetyltransferase [Glycomyces terrestris]